MVAQVFGRSSPHVPIVELLAAGGKCRIASHAIGDVSHVVTAGQTQTMELCVWDLLESTKPFVGPFYGFRTYSLHNEIF